MFVYCDYSFVNNFMVIYFVKCIVVSFFEFFVVGISEVFVVFICILVEVFNRSNVF